MKWPWGGKLEKRADSYTDLLVAALTSRATGGVASASATGALEACAGLVGRAFAGASIDNAPDRITEALDPAVLCMIGRAMIRSGEILLLSDVRDGQLFLTPVASHSVSGGPNADSWVYEATLAGPSQSTTRRLQAEGVLHIRYACDPATPWRGVGPLQAASLAGRLSAEVSTALADEASTPHGYLLPLPVDGADETVAALKADLAGSRGGLSLVESVAGRFSTDDARSGPRGDWQAKRIGASPPEALIALAKHSSNEIYAACGLSPSLFTADGESGQREAFRRALGSVLLPMAKIAESELRLKLEAPGLSITFENLRASDLTGRARAFASLVSSGLEIGKAAQLAGLVVDD